MCPVKKGGQAEVVQDSLLRWWPLEVPLTPLLSFALFQPYHSSSLSFFFPMYSELQRTKKKKKGKKKRHVGKGKEADGLARGKGAASLSHPQSGGAFLVCFCLAYGYNLLNPWRLTCSPNPQQPWSALFRPSLTCGQKALGLAARPGSSGHR